LSVATFMVVGVTLILPFSPLAEPFGFRSLPILFLFVLVGIIALYVFAAEMAKKIFYAKVKF